MKSVVYFKEVVILKRGSFGAFYFEIVASHRMFGIANSKPRCFHGEERAQTRQQRGYIVWRNAGLDQQVFFWLCTNITSLSFSRRR